MIVGNLAIALNLMSVAVLAFIICIVFISAIAKLFIPKLNNTTFTVRKFSLWLLITAPWWVATLCIALFWPRQSNGVYLSWFEELAHWHHIDIFNFFSWHAITLMLASLFVVGVCISVIYRKRKQSASLSNLLDFAQDKKIQGLDNSDYLTLSVPTPIAFTTGLLSPKIYISTGLQEQVSEQELAIILKHEAAHVEARDPLFKVLFSVFAGFFPSSIKLQLLDKYTLLTEQLADSKVASKYDNLDVAQTLINVARMQRNISNHHVGTSISHFGYDQTNTRIQSLIKPITSTPRTLLLTAAVLTIVMPLLTASTVDSFHHFIETIFTH
ncbi:M56 family metallopeptidase [Colwellia sp. RSH04]|uniref:M56 family metallopeptidase n=1 Tax=Colwellia sp. RSH04 TaxID=2305464 RepID=UPI000E5910B9|nr:M56 family metallopeptidase [Colwellia sp. RSH04]RHW77309.1 M56 family peptidase [Colwellia sp. RSH04]